MPHALVEQYLDERDKLLNTISVLKANATDRGSDPTDDELDVMKRGYARIDKLDELMKVVGEDRELDDETRDKLLRSGQQGPVEGGIKYRTAGDMVWDCLHANFGSTHDHDDGDAKRRWDGVMKRAAQHMGTKAADTTPVAGDLGGLYVAPVVGPVIDLSPKGQPFLSAIGRTPAPNSMTFMRPRIVDPNFTTGAAPQALEKGELTSVKFDVKVDTITLDTVGGYLNISQQLMSLQPASLGIIVSQLGRRTAYQGEKAALTELALTTAKVTLSATPTSAAVITALYDAAALVYANTKELPTWMAYGPGGWKMLGSLVDAAGRQLFPFLGASNALGSSAGLGSFNIGPLGLQQILTPGIAGTAIYMGNELGLEAYVYSFPILEAIEPALLGRQVAVAEALAFYRPTTQEATPGPLQQNGAVLIGP